MRGYRNSNGGVVRLSSGGLQSGAAARPCCCGSDCENRTACADGSPTLLETCTGAFVFSNRITATVSGGATGTVNIPANAQLEGRSMSGGSLTYDIDGMDIDVSWSGSVSIDVRRIGDLDSGTSFDYLVGAETGLMPCGSASGSCTWSIDWGGSTPPPNWTEEEDLGVAVAGGASAAGFGNNLTFQGSVSVSRSKRFSFTYEGDTEKFYLTLSAGGTTTISYDASATGIGADICAGDTINASSSSGTSSLFATNDINQEATIDTQSQSLSATFKRETDVSGDLQCGACERAIDVEYVVTVSNSVTGDTSTGTSTGRFVQWCPQDACLPNRCTWQVDGDGWTTVTERSWASTTTTTEYNILLGLATRCVSGGMLWNFSGASGSFGSFTTTGPCPSESPVASRATSYAYNADGSVGVTTTRSITITASDPVEGDPDCFCDGYEAYDTGEVTSGGSDQKWEVEDANESGSFMPAVVETTNPFLIYYSVPRTGSAWVGIDAAGSAYTGIRTYRTKFRVSTPRDIRAKVSSDNRTLAVIVNGDVVATNATPADTTSHELKHTVHLPNTAMRSGWNDLEVQVEDLGEVSGLLWEWQGAD